MTYLEKKFPKEYAEYNELILKKVNYGDVTDEDVHNCEFYKILTQTRTGELDFTSNQDNKPAKPKDKELSNWFNGAFVGLVIGLIIGYLLAGVLIEKKIEKKSEVLIENKSKSFMKAYKDGDVFRMANGADSIHIEIENGYINVFEFMPNGKCNIYSQNQNPNPSVVPYNLNHFDEVYRDSKISEDGRCLYPKDAFL